MSWGATTSVSIWIISSGPQRRKLLKRVAPFLGSVRSFVATNLNNNEDDDDDDVDDNGGVLDRSER